jgi:glycosyltransferase involved in cell wall biosynthesis
VAFQDGGGAVDILGDSGFLVRDINELCQVIERMRQDSKLRSMLSQRAKRRALEFDIEHTAHNFQKMYTELAKK